MSKRMLAIVGGVLGGAAILAAVYFLFLGSSGAEEVVAEAAEGEDGVVAEEVVAVRVDGKLGPHITLPDRVFTLVSPAAAPRYAKLEIVLEFETDDASWFEARGEALEERLAEFMEELPIALIQDAITSTVSSKSAADIASQEGKDALRSEIREAVSALLPEPQVRRVLFTNFITQ